LSSLARIVTIFIIHLIKKCTTWQVLHKRFIWLVTSLLREGWQEDDAQEYAILYADRTGYNKHWTWWWKGYRRQHRHIVIFKWKSTEEARGQFYGDPYFRKIFYLVLLIKCSLPGLQLKMYTMHLTNLMSCAIYFRYPLLFYWYSNSWLPA